MMSLCVDVMMSHVLYTCKPFEWENFREFRDFARVLLNKLFYQDVMTWR